MTQLPRAAALYIAAMVVCACGLAAVAIARADPPGARDLVLAAGLAALMALACCFPLPFTHRTKLTLDSSVLFAAALLLPAGPAMLAAASGTLFAHALRRTPRVQAAFNGAQTALQAGVAAALLGLAGWDHAAPQFDAPRLLAVVALAGAAMYLINTLSVAVIVGLQSGLSPWRFWSQAVRFDAAEELAQLALGLLTAAMVNTHAWTLPLLIVLGFAVYLALERHIRLRRQTIDAVESLADVVDLRDPYTADHSRRVASYAREIATALRLAPDEVADIETAARVHDVGKILIDKELLAKVAPLQADDWVQLREHPLAGERILNRFPQFVAAARYVRSHHERVDGTGYPDGLAGERIPLGARVIAVADALDAMVTARPFRDALAPAAVLQELTQQRGCQFDARVVDALIELIEAGRVVLPNAIPTDAGRDASPAARPIVA